jgi:homocysteine S-methyltransferase
MKTQSIKYRDNLPQLGSKMFIADGGLETSLIFLCEIDLPLLAAFPLIASDEGIAQLESYFAPYIEIAIASNTGIVLDTPTWRCSKGWCEQLGYTLRDTQFFTEARVCFL